MLLKLGCCVKPAFPRLTRTIATKLKPSQAAEARKAFDREAERLSTLKEKQSWSDKIIISQDTQVRDCACSSCVYVCVG